MNAQNFSYNSIVFNILLFVLILCGSSQSIQAQQKSLTFGDILVGLESKGNEVTLAQKNKSMTKKVKELGVNFPLTGGIKTELKYAGANPQLINAIRNSSRGNPTAVAYLERGYGYVNKGLYNEAIAEYNKAIKNDPGFAYAYNSRGIVYKTKGEFDQAIADFNKALELDPGLVFTYNNRGVAYGYMKQYDLAIADFSKAIELHPNYVKAYNSRGLAYYLKGDYDRAIADYRRALEIDPNYQLTKVNLQQALKKKRNQ